MGQGAGDGHVEGIAGHTRLDSDHYSGSAPRELERVLAIIRKDVSEDKVKIDAPTQNLERYFLAVVQSARQAAAETSGAMSGARVAAYLRGEGEAKPASDKILERLAAPQAAVPAPSPALLPVDTRSQQKLDALTKPAEPAAPHWRQQPRRQDRPATRSCAKPMRSWRR